MNDSKKAESAFKDLSKDYNSKKRYVSNETSARDLPEKFKDLQSFSKELVERLMEDNIIIKEDPTKLQLKNPKKKVMSDKLVKILLERLENSKE